jgi:CheY-like chemotaxis protein
MESRHSISFSVAETTWVANPQPGPAIVLLDLKLPRISGLEVLRRIREDAGARIIPVIIFTSSSEGQDVQEAYTLGANSHVCKPVDYGEFCHKLKQVVSYWLVSCQLPCADFAPRNIHRYEQASQRSGETAGTA